MSRIINSTFTNEFAEKVSYLAKAQGMSVSSYISNLVKEQSISSDNTFEAEQEEPAGKGDERISIKLSGDYAQLLKKKATEYGDTPSQYVKRLLRTGGKIYNLEMVQRSREEWDTPPRGCQNTTSGRQPACRRRLGHAWATKFRAEKIPQPRRLRDSQSSAQNRNRTRQITVNTHK